MMMYLKRYSGSEFFITKDVIGRTANAMRRITDTSSSNLSDQMAGDPGATYLLTSTFDIVHC